jgi:hypothetical protein
MSPGGTFRLRFTNGFRRPARRPILEPAPRSAEFHAFSLLFGRHAPRQLQPRDCTKEFHDAKG